MKNCYLRTLFLVTILALLAGCTAALADDFDLDKTANILETNEFIELDDILTQGMEEPELELDLKSELQEDVLEATKYVESNDGNSDFVIDGNGVLTKYSGRDSDVIIPDGVTSIGDSAFKYCYDLTSVTLPGSVTSIGKEAFSDCTKLTSVSIQNGLISIGEHAFSFCSSLANITLPGSVTSFEKGAFSNSGLTSITIPGSVTSFGEDTFFGCNKLTSVTISKGVTGIGNFAFKNCNNLASVTIPGSVVSIGNYAFEACDGLTNVNIPNGVASIGTHAFAGCHGLTSVTIPGSVTDMGEYVFWCCYNLENLVLQDGVSCIGYAAFQNTGLTSVTIPGSVTSMGGWAFAECANLTSVTILDGATVIGWGAFDKCTSLTSVTIPASVTDIGELVFNGCPSTLIIHGEADSAAEAWAEKHGFEFDDGTVKPESISITNGKSAELEVGKELTLNTSVTPSNAVKRLTWSSSDESVATVSDAGVVKGVAKGNADITVTTRNKKKAVITVKVIAPKPTKVTITNGKTATLMMGKKLTLKTKFTPANAESKLTWNSSDTTVATVSSKGVVKGIKKGTATITVTTANGKKANIKVKVVAPKPTKVTITNGKTATLKVGKKLTLKTKFTPANAESKLTWNSSDTTVATVSNKGVVNGIKKGTATITVTTANGKKANIKITVKN